MFIHIYPRVDLKEHTLTTTCECSPNTEKYHDNFIVVHGAFDGREAIEEFNEIMGLPQANGEWVSVEVD